MTFYQEFAQLLPILYPSFYIAKDKLGREFVFLIESDDRSDIAEDMIIDSCVAVEAFANHVHLFNKVGIKYKDLVVKIGTAIAKNLLNTLIQAFPDRKFVVYLEVNIKDSTIVRFHQIWEDEPLYFDVKQFKQDGLEIFEFMS